MNDPNEHIRGGEGRVVNILQVSFYISFMSSVSLSHGIFTDTCLILSHPHR